MPMKIAIAQINPKVGDLKGNARLILEAAQKASEAGARLMLTPELSLCGYPPRDFLEFSDFIRRCDEVIQKMAKLADGIAILVGSPSVTPVPEGKDLFNSAWFLADPSVVLPAAFCSARHVRFGRVLVGRGLCVFADEPVDLRLE